MDFCGYKLDGKQRFLFMAGPCVIESREMIMDTAEHLKEICERLGLFFVFKSSYDKANRSSISSYRGPGPEIGLKILSEVKEKFGIPVVTDVHSVQEIERAGQVADVLQIPAFLCRQTDLLIAAAKSGKAVNVKKGQFVAPADTGNIVKKLIANNCKSYAITERGYSFGYNNLIVDMRSFEIIRSLNIPVIFDATHSVQLPGGNASGGSEITGGERQFIPLLARSAVAAGIDGLFMEVHPDPSKALCDATNQFQLDKIEELLKILIEIDDVVKKTPHRID